MGRVYTDDGYKVCDSCGSNAVWMYEREEDLEPKESSWYRCIGCGKQNQTFKWWDKEQEREPKCHTCGVGGCFHCEPHRFIIGIDRWNGGRG